MFQQTVWQRVLNIHLLHTRMMLYFILTFQT